MAGSCWLLVAAIAVDGQVASVAHAGGRLACSDLVVDSTAQHPRPAVHPGQCDSQRRLPICADGATASQPAGAQGRLHGPGMRGRFLVRGKMCRWALEGGRMDDRSPLQRPTSRGRRIRRQRAGGLGTGSRWDAGRASVDDGRGGEIGGATDVADVAGVSGPRVGRRPSH
ncbi:hypothetical protein BS50DRAFT_379746 [Corynespora cassiicola Philippines]|uniref:Uncharacterized protein n=1 Tax=Corynespora cassiicola Philippines TaxID=1448308 RepID=A0A2T2NNI8_CORCC|nr:hypothetical protein BS50DRAFT_379746 [Corynespora cassiicola Philippines]